MARGNKHSIKNILLTAFLTTYFVAAFFIFYKTELPGAVRGTLLFLNIPAAFLVFRLRTFRVSAVMLILYVVVAGFLIDVPRLPVINESIRSHFFHVCMWFVMVVVLVTSVVYSILYLRTEKYKHDIIASECAAVGVLFGILGLLTGMLWATYSWGVPWHNDPKQIATAVALLIYLAQFVLRSSLTDEQQRARIGSIYNIFALPSFWVLIYILPRMTPNSLHPGAEGNPGFGAYDLDDDMKLVYYPALFAWGLIAAWLITLRVRYRILKLKVYDLGL